MKLAQYLESTSTTASALAAKIGKPASTITRLLNGTRDPNFQLVAAIVRATEGKVSYEDFEDEAIEAVRAEANA